MHPPSPQHFIQFITATSVGSKISDLIPKELCEIKRSTGLRDKQPKGIKLKCWLCWNRLFLWYRKLIIISLDVFITHGYMNKWTCWREQLLLYRKNGYENISKMYITYLFTTIASLHIILPTFRHMHMMCLLPEASHLSEEWIQHHPKGGR